MLRVILIAATVGLAASSARATCTAPAAPAAAERPSQPVMPARPACAASGPCAPGEADAYNKAVAAFNTHRRDHEAAAQAYVAKLNAYVAAAEVFAKCEVAELSASK